jgi:hypothetical protein
MGRILAIAAALAFLGACSSGGSGCGGDAGEKKSSGESTGMSGGGGAPSGGLGEAVSFQGLGKKKDPPPPEQPAQAAASPGGAAPASAAAPAAASAPQAVICGGFPNLPADCSKDPAFDAIKKKCCPTGQVEACQGIPGGARLIGRSCTATVR